VVGGCQKTLIAWTCDSVGLLIVDCCLGLLDLGFFFFFLCVFWLLFWWVAGCSLT
jgi:hypothetical protein